MGGRKQSTKNTTQITETTTIGDIGFTGEQASQFASVLGGIVGDVNEQAFSTIQGGLDNLTIGAASLGQAAASIGNAGSVANATPSIAEIGSAIKGTSAASDDDAAETQALVGREFLVPLMVAVVVAIAIRE